MGTGFFPCHGLSSCFMDCNGILLISGGDAKFDNVAPVIMIAQMIVCLIVMVFGVVQLQLMYVVFVAVEWPM